MAAQESKRPAAEGMRAGATKLWIDERQPARMAPRSSSALARRSFM
jgi:hypothetical protein